jgi:hypothetical protein
MFKPYRIASSCFKNGEQPCLNVAKYPTGLDEKAEDIERIVLSQQHKEKSSKAEAFGSHQFIS